MIPAESELFFKTVSIKNDRYKEQIISLLNLSSLSLDPSVELFVIAQFEGKVIACAGLQQNVIKCVAILPEYRGQNLNLILIQNVINLAYEQSESHLFLYTKSENITFFNHCGFHLIVETPDGVALMENTPVGIAHYCKQLEKQRKADEAGVIVMNANPFSLGHLYLAETAASQVEWLYIFVVSEDKSLFSAADRFELVKAGVAHLENVTVLPSSQYIISRATFPTYFLKDKVLIEKNYMAIDLLLFRNYIAPALKINRRYVGTEPKSEVTQAYNEAMKYLLESSSVSLSPSIEVIEYERKNSTEGIISATTIRYALDNQNYDLVRKLVPDSTWNYLQLHYPINIKQDYK